LGEREGAWERGREGGMRERERERDQRVGVAPSNELGPVRVFVRLIYSTLDIEPGNGCKLSQNFGGGPYIITASENGFMEAVVLRRLLL